MKKLNADIVVISAGTAGLAAAVAAAQTGACVIAFEKNAKTGGTGVHAGGPFAVESSVQRMKQINITKEDAFEIYMNFTQWRADARLVRAFIDKSASTIDWLQDMGVEFSAVVAHNPGYNFTWHVVKGERRPSGQGNYAAYLMETLAEKASELKVEIHLKTPVKKILSKAGRIAGVLAEDESGEEIQAESKAVIVATGGYGGNFPVMVSGLNGDGIRMARDLGAAVTDKTKLPAGAMGRGRMIPGRASTTVRLVFSQPNLMVNLLGERFMNEEYTVTSPFGNNAILRQKDRTAVTIFDEDIKNYYVNSHLDLVPDSLMPINKATTFDEEFKEMLERGSDNVFMADSIEELAVKTGVKPDVLKNTIDEYNTACTTGRDEIFNKKARYLRPIKTPKFYANKQVNPPVQNCEGIRINYKTEVLTEDWEVIPGLYAAGTDAMCNIYTDMYPIILPGTAFGFCINSGRMAAESAVEYIRSVSG